MDKGTVKTDCIFYCDYLHREGCSALRGLYCKSEECSFYKKRGTHEKANKSDNR